MRDSTLEKFYVSHFSTIRRSVIISLSPPLRYTYSVRTVRKNNKTNKGPSFPKHGFVVSLQSLQLLLVATNYETANTIGNFSSGSA